MLSPLYSTLVLGMCLLVPTITPSSTPVSESPWSSESTVTMETEILLNNTESDLVTKATTGMVSDDSKFSPGGTDTTVTGDIETDQTSSGLNLELTSTVLEGLSSVASSVQTDGETASSEEGTTEIIGFGTDNGFSSVSTREDLTTSGSEPSTNGETTTEGALETTDSPSSTLGVEESTSSDTETTEGLQLTSTLDKGLATTRGQEEMTTPDNGQGTSEGLEEDSSAANKASTEIPSTVPEVTSAAGEDGTTRPESTSDGGAGVSTGKPEVTSERSETGGTTESEEAGTQATEGVTPDDNDVVLDWWAILLICLAGILVAGALVGLVVYFIKRQRHVEMYAHELLTYDPPMKEYLNGSHPVAFNSADPLDVDDIIAQPQRQDGVVPGESEGLVASVDTSFHSFSNPNYES